jgi:uncharacterized protein (TIRG00374 family)
MTDSQTANQNATAPRPQSSRRQWLLRGAVIVIVLGLSVWYVVGSIDWQGLRSALLSVRIAWVLLGAASTLGAHLARAQRWKALIPEGGSISLLNSFSATIVGYLMNNVIPRSGELVRPYVLAKRENRSMSGLVATVLVERILDGLTLAAIFLVLLALESQRLDQIFGNSAGTLRNLIIPVIVLAVGVLVILKTPLGERLLIRIERLLPEKLSGKLMALYHNFRAGVTFGGARSLLSIIFWTIIIWGGYAAAVYCNIVAFGFDSLYGLGAGDSLVILAITAVGVSIAPTPGAFGVYHSFCKAALTSIYHIPAASAVAFALVAHAAPYLAVMIVGALFLLRENVSLKEFSRQNTRRPEPAGPEPEEPSAVSPTASPAGAPGGNPTE